MESLLTNEYRRKLPSTRVSSLRCNTFQLTRGSWQLPRCKTAEGYKSCCNRDLPSPIMFLVICGEVAGSTLLPSFLLLRAIHLVEDMISGSADDGETTRGEEDGTWGRSLSFGTVVDLTLFYWCSDFASFLQYPSLYTHYTSLLNLAMYRQPIQIPTV